MRQSRNLKWNYFPENSAQLLDKIYKFEDTTFELGGMAAINILQIKKNTIAVHTTCYEQKSKVMGLKVSLFTVFFFIYLISFSLSIFYIYFFFAFLPFCSFHSIFYFYFYTFFHFFFFIHLGS